MKLSKWLSQITLGSLILGTLLGSFSLQAQQIGAFFRKSPLLTRSATTFKNSRVPSRYIFTIDIPRNAGASLGRVTILQQPNFETIRFYPDEFEAFLGEGTKGTPIPIKSLIARDGTLKIQFETPVEPGNRVTLSLSAINPLYGGIYQFRITVFPPGEDSQGLYLGIGRLHFSQPGGRP